MKKIDMSWKENKKALAFAIKWLMFLLVVGVIRALIWHSESMQISIIEVAFIIVIFLILVFLYWLTKKDIKDETLKK